MKGIMQGIQMAVSRIHIKLRRMHRVFTFSLPNASCRTPRKNLLHEGLTSHSTILYLSN
jgi:hypothetical protein